MVNRSVETEIPDDTIDHAVSTSTTSPVSTDGGNLLNLHLKNTMIIKFCVMMIFVLGGTIGNGVMVHVIRKTWKKRNKTNILVVGLTISDILVGFTSTMYIAIYQLIAFGLFSSPCRYIKVTAASFTITKCASMAGIAMMVAISMDRYIAIAHPFKYETLITDRWAMWSVGIAWVFGISIGVAHAIYLYWVDLSSCNAPYSRVMQSLLDNGSYGLVTILMMTTYGRILKIALDHRSRIGAMLDSSSDSAGRAEGFRFKSEFKAVRTTASILGSFVIFWFPYEFGVFLQSIGVVNSQTQTLIDIGLMLGLGMHAINWLVYGMSNKEFRSELHMVFQFSHEGSSTDNDGTRSVQSTA